jgi:hypothetical protein
LIRAGDFVIAAEPTRKMITLECPFHHPKILRPASSSLPSGPAWYLVYSCRFEIVLFNHTLKLRGAQSVLSLLSLHNLGLIKKSNHSRFGHETNSRGTPRASLGRKYLGVHHKVLNNTYNLGLIMPSNLMIMGSDKYS